MSISAWEHATLNFYEWDHRGRGYYFFDSQVAIEPPYIPFYHKWNSGEKYIDDGKIPTILEQFVDIFKTKKPQTQQKQNTQVKVKPNPTSKLRLDVGISLAFRRDQEISYVLSKEFLDLLSFTDAPISFEIHGSFNTITINIACSSVDHLRIESHLKAYFPSVIISATDLDLDFDSLRPIAICDFGIDEEVARPIQTHTSFEVDPLTSIITVLDNLQYGDSAIFQIIFQGVKNPWARDIPYAVSDGSDGSFFEGNPEMPKCAKQKISAPLFGCVFRIAAQGTSKERSQYIASQLTNSISAISKSEYNKLIPLSNKGYSYDDHLYNLHHRTSNRLGMILNSNELVSFLHYPNKTVISQKLGIQGLRSKALPSETMNQKYVLGINEHNGSRSVVTLNDESRLRHTHIIGATGVGKSTLIAQMIFEDIRHGNGCVLFDPHGDIVDDVLARIPSSRKDDVIIIDPSDPEYSIGFNLLSATTEAEKIVLSSDLVSAFKRHATAWGDNMTAVLSNAINTFLESSKGGTLIELKRFLLEDLFRADFLKTVDDRSIHYYWQHEYPMMKKGITPLLTRIDTFLRPKIVKYMLAQKKGIDFRACMEEKKIVLIKLSQGLIGETNSYLLGALLLSKFNQVAQGRQGLSKEKRHPYYLYLDEFQNFITPSIASILSGARKYGLGLILAHQELAQLREPTVLNSVISNPNIRICFRLGDIDAKRLESGFSSFEQDDLQNLDIGEAVMRVGGSSNDFNIRTSPMQKVEEISSGDIAKKIITVSQKKYGTPISEVKRLLDGMLPVFHNTDKQEPDEVISPPKKERRHRRAMNTSQSNTSRSSEEGKKYIKQTQERQAVRTHVSLQNTVKTLAQQRGFKASIEESTNNGGRVDIGLLRDELKIAVEISVTNTLDYEVQNIQKCIDGGYGHICMLSNNMIHLKNIKSRAQITIKKEDLQKVQFIIPLEFTSYLDSFTHSPTNGVKRVRGYKVKSNQVDITEAGSHEKNQNLQEIILSGLKKSR